MVSCLWLCGICRPGSPSPTSGGQPAAHHASNPGIALDSNTATSSSNREDDDQCAVAGSQQQSLRPHLTSARHSNPGPNNSALEKFEKFCPKGSPRAPLKSTLHRVLHLVTLWTLSIPGAPSPCRHWASNAPPPAAMIWPATTSYTATAWFALVAAAPT